MCLCVCVRVRCSRGVVFPRDLVDDLVHLIDSHEFIFYLVDSSTACVVVIVPCSSCSSIVAYFLRMTSAKNDARNPIFGFFDAFFFSDFRFWPFCTFHGERKCKGHGFSVKIIPFRQFWYFAAPTRVRIPINFKRRIDGLEP